MKNPGLIDGILAAVRQLSAIRYRRGNGVKFDPVHVVVVMRERIAAARVDGQVLAAAVAPELDRLGPAEPRIGYHDRAVTADELELVTPRQFHPHVELGEHVVSEPHGSREPQVDAVGVEYRLAVDPLRISCEQPCRADAVTTEI